MTTLTNHSCWLCSSVARFRCSNCHKPYYCSKHCQAKDWKLRHRKVCRAWQANDELFQLVQTYGFDRAQQEYYQTTDEIQRLKDSNHQYDEAEEAKPLPPAPNLPQRRTTPSDQLHHDKPSSVSKPTIRFHIQHMTNLHCYNLTLLNFPLDLLQTSLKALQTESITTTLVGIRRGDHTLLQLELPGRIQNVHAYNSEIDDKTGPVSLRLSYEPMSVPELNESELVDHNKCRTMEMSAKMACHSCDYVLATSSALEIQRALPLPSGRWDDMMDYLVCYPGQPAIDMGAVAVPPTDCLLQDDTFVVLQEKHVHVCVLAVTGYGETEDDDSDDKDPLARGGRPWRDGVGGATVTCPKCASILGFALDSSCRLMKHRLKHTACSVVDFVAHEMIRYAETKAIFAFFLQKQESNQCMWLRLLSWDTTAAMSSDAEVNSAGVCRVVWRRVVQVIYEAGNVGRDNELKRELLEWTWARDWCCPTEREEKTETGTAPLSYVRLSLCPNEWNAVFESLHGGSKFYADSVASSTILARTGQPTGDSTGLAALVL